VREHERAVLVVEVLIEAKPRCRAPEQARERSLAHCERVAAQIVAVEFEQVEGEVAITSAPVQMLWGERRGRGTFGAVQRLPMELPMSQQHCHFDASRSLTALEQDSTIIAVIEMSQSKWLVAALVPGVER
jgi:hypothetical protein